MSGRRAMPGGLSSAGLSSAGLSSAGHGARR